MSEFKEMMETSRLLANRLGRLETAVFIRNWMQEQGLDLPKDLRLVLTDFVEKPVEGLTNEDIAKTDR